MQQNQPETKEQQNGPKKELPELISNSMLMDMSKPIIPEHVIKRRQMQKQIQQQQQQSNNLSTKDQHQHVDNINPEMPQLQQNGLSKCYNKPLEPCKDINCKECLKEKSDVKTTRQQLNDLSDVQMPTKFNFKKDDQPSTTTGSTGQIGQADPDKERISKIIEQAAKHSEFYQKEENKKKECLLRIKRFRSKIHTLQANVNQWNITKEMVNGKILSYLQDRFIDRTWIYIDMDMFFAAVEIRDNPELKDKPIAVFNNQMIMTGNYVARRFGVSSGMPKFIGARLCPEITFIEANYSKYKHESDQFKDILAQYDSKYESQGLDEASIDVTEFLKSNNMDNMEGKIFLGSKIRSQIYESTELTASCGIACNKLLAKICSGLKKPNGMTYLDFDQDEITNFMNNLPINKLMGIGKVHQRVLTGLGVKMCQDMIEKATEIYVNYNESQFQFFMRSALGIDRNYHEDTVQKSIGVSQTIKPIHEKKEHDDRVRAMAIELYERLKESELMAKTLTLELKTVRFNIKQRSTNFHTYIWEKSDIVRASEELLNVMWPVGEPVRLIGIRLMQLRTRIIPKTKSGKGRQDISDPSLTHLRTSSNSDERFNNRISMDSVPSDEEEEQQPIKPEDIGLHFDRARMNSSNRRAVDHFKTKKSVKESTPPASEIESQINSCKQSGQTFSCDLSGNKSSRAKKNGCDITSFLKKSNVKPQYEIYQQQQQHEYDLDDLLSEFDGSNKQEQSIDQNQVHQKPEYKNLRLTEKDQQNQEEFMNKFDDNDGFTDNQDFDNDFGKYRGDDEYDLFERDFDESQLNSAIVNECNNDDINHLKASAINSNYQQTNAKRLRLI
eukprot:403343212